MTTYRKRPVVIEATQWFKNGDHPQDGVTMQHHEQCPISRKLLHYVCGCPPGWPLSDNEGKVVRYFRRPDVPGDKECEHCWRPMNDHGWIDTAQGGHTVCPGDWIINEPTLPGQYYPCKPDAFEATYEEVL